MVVMGIFAAADALEYIICNPGFIPQIFNSVVTYVNACIISLSLMFFVAVVIMALQSYTHYM